MFKLNTDRWHILRINFLMAGVISLISLLLNFFIGSNWWLLIVLFVSLMQINFAITGFCPSAIILDKLKFPRE